MKIPVLRFLWREKFFIKVFKFTIRGDNPACRRVFGPVFAMQWVVFQVRKDISTHAD